MSIIIAGDPHGDHKPILRACADHPPGLLVLLGDLDLEEPLRRVFARPLNEGWRVRYIVGNHDVDQPRYYDNLMGDAQDWNLSGSFVEADGLVIGGLGGVFKGSNWYPRAEEEAEATWRTRAEYLRQLRPPERWKKGMPLRQRDTIFPEDLEKAGKLRLDVLVTHEAPLPHRYGFVALNGLAGRTGARLLVHGHHHRTEAYTASLPGGRTLHVQSLAKAEPWVLEMPDEAPVGL
jgi:predicted phosphodiesterase